MAEIKSKVTLIGAMLARPGLEFIYEGELPACEQCKVRKACNNLKVGRKYKVLSIRTTVHGCSVHMNGACAVEIVESPVVGLIKGDLAIVNSRILPDLSCNQSECKSYPLCHPDGVVSGERYVVSEVLGNAPDRCEKGRLLKLVGLCPI